VTAGAVSCQYLWPGEEGMGYDEKLAERIRRALGPRDDVEERKMFGGLAFLRGGRMFCGIANDELMVRVGPEQYEKALQKPHVRPMDFTGRPMKGYVYVAAAGRRTEAALRAWVDLSARFVGTLPAGPAKKSTRGRRRRR
jgi:TfoX/Sxy family transcriptional regulator of competence genes